MWNFYSIFAVIQVYLLRIIKIKTLKDFWKKHPDAEIGLPDL